ncbi:MAG: ribosome silencing factor, partial [Bryocella sp.]
MTKIEIRCMVTAAAAACEEKKAERIRILELDPSDSGFTDYFLICSGTNNRQNQAIATGIEQVMKRDFNTLPNSVEGYRQAEWILLDYVDFVVHIFSEEKRDFYDIERLRKTATTLGLE